MSDMPEKIYAWPSAITPPDETALAGQWAGTRYQAEAEAYTRSGIEWNEALEAAARRCRSMANAVQGKDDAMELAYLRAEEAIRAMKREPK